MLHLNCTFTLRAKRKHQFDTYSVKIHLEVHKIMSVLYISLFSVIAMLAFWQSWTRKQEVGHCDLILQPIFFNLIILKSKVPLMLHTKYQPNIPCQSGEKVDFISFAIFSIGSHLGFSTKRNFIILKP